MSGHHILNVPAEYDQIHFPSQDSLLDPVLLIGNSSFQIYQGSQEDCFKIYDRISEWLEQS